MARSITVKPKKRGRPSTGGRDPIVGVRFPPETVKALETEAKARGMGKSELVRVYVDEGLERSGKAKR